MLAMLVVATALTRITCVHSRPSNEDEFDAPSHMAKSYTDDDSPDVSEQLGNHDNHDIDRDVRKRNEGKAEKYDVPQREEKSTTETEATAASVTMSLVHQHTEEAKKRPSNHNDEIDVVDREDHVTQYLADLLVNTDSEITSLQASETEDDREGIEVKEDTFFAFLTGQEKHVEVEGAWSHPADDLKNEDLQHNAISDVEYKE